MEFDNLKLSKVISHALRHEPEFYNLQLDEEGYVKIADLKEALITKGWNNLRLDDIETLVKKQDKIRHEIKDNMIRAYYGHSTSQSVIKYRDTEPPELLYHGTNLNNYHGIIEKGLLPMSRQFVHLSETIDIARKVGDRKSGKTIILIIESQKAYIDGVKFHNEPNGIWLSETIPPIYIRNEIS